MSIPLRVRTPARSLVVEVAAVALSLPMLVPFLLILVNSFKSPEAANRLELALPTSGLAQIVENYAAVIREAHLLTAYANTLIVSAFSVAAIVVCAATSAFVIQRRRQRIVAAINFCILAGMTLPSSVVPTYFIIDSMGLARTHLGVILAYTSRLFPLAVFLYTGYYKSIHRELDESAVIDGCTPPQTFARVIFPLLQPITVTVIIITFMSVWNEFEIAIFLLNSPRRFTVTLTTFFFFGQRTVTGWNLLFANVVLISLPVVVLYFFLQRFIASGLAAGGVKG